MKRLRLLLLITNLGKGGAQRVFHDHALAFSAVHDVEEAVFDLGHDHRIYDTGLPLHDLQHNGWLSKLGPVGRLFSRAFALRRLVRERKFDIVVSHLDGANWVNVLSGTSAKKIAVVHGSVLYDQGQSRWRKWFRLHVIPRVIYDWATTTVAVSQGVGKELREACGLSNVQVIRNFFEVQRIRDLARDLLPEGERQVFEGGHTMVTSGRLTPGKRQSALLKMSTMLKARGANCRLVVLGDGESRDDLLSEARRLGLHVFDVWSPTVELSADFDVYFLGYVTNPYRYLARSTLFVFPSAWEGFPLALCEAMIAGVPVLSADCPTGPREILASGTVRETYDLRQAELAQNGVLLPMVESPQDLEVWVETVERLLADAGQREQLQRNAAQAVKALDRDAVVGQWLALLKQVAHA